MSNIFDQFGPIPFQQRPAAPYRGWTNPAYALDKRQAKREAVANQRVADWVQTGQTIVTLPADTESPTGWGKGEALVPVSFTQTVIELPHYTYGWSLVDSSLVQAGSFPDLSAGVHDWDTQAAGYATTYTGCTIGVVLEGAIGLQFLIHYTFTGKAMTDFGGAFNDAGSV